jgi:D-3-phosphoglycerate dehydrogenase
MIDKEALSMMKPSSFLINTARGGVVDTSALVDALRNGTIEYAGLDVHESEPLESDSPLFELENVVLSDHCAWYTEESLVELKTRAAQNVAAVLTGGTPDTPVNKPATT